MLIKCPECGHQVSDQAQTCPSCGIAIAGHVTPALPSMPDPAPKPKPKHRKTFTALIVAFVIALIVVFLGIYFMKDQEQQNEMRAYHNAIQSTEPQVLQNFLDMYGDAPAEHLDSVKFALDALRKVETDWKNAIVSNSRFAYEQFLKQHPQSVHNVEANIKIDSLDWVKAVKENTAESFQTYLMEHGDGAYYDEARSQYEQIESQKITAEDRQMVVQLFTDYFNAIAQMDEPALTTLVAPVMTSFLHRQNATVNDVRQYMLKMHEADITRMTFTPNDDWVIEKSDVGDGQYSYKVNFSVAQHIDRTDESRETSVVYKVAALVSPVGRISELNMKRSVQTKPQPIN